ncbi:hypothetical protein [uncultured Bradyrhizobium sp.]|uniref:hypothetical protein n=1 Tax=Bradyrhizobium sp. TaxID=376 RepID=UPI002621AF81|nr:hypothetical protein [uncultured Bradyrhizobium sp.]
MKVRELVQVLQALPDQDATVVIGEGAKPETWLIVSGVAECRIARVNEDHAIAGSEPAIEIV